MSSYKLSYSGSKVQHLLNIVNEGVAPREHHHDLATEEFSGFMSPEDKKALSKKIDGAYVENGYLYLTSEDNIIAGPLGPFGSSSSGDDSMFTTTVTDVMENHIVSLIMLNATSNLIEEVEE